MKYIHFRAKITNHTIDELCKLNDLTAWQKGLLTGLSAKCMQTMETQVFYDEVSPGQYYVLMTLGEAFDTLSNQYIEKEELSGAYLLDLIAMELLNSSYEVLGQSLMQLEGRAGYELKFIDDITSEDCMNRFRALEQEVVSMTQTGQLRPLKSVILMIGLTDEPGKKDSCQNLCDTCPNPCNMKRRSEKGNE